MSMNKMSSGRSSGCLVNKYIGSDFDAVVDVATNIEDVNKVAGNIEDVVLVSLTTSGTEQEMGYGCTALR